MTSELARQLTETDRDRIAAALDAYVYWQLADDHYKRNGEVIEPGSDTEETADEIAACNTLIHALTTTDDSTVRRTLSDSPRRRRPTNAMKHSDTCTRVFRRLDPACPRCQELANGAAPRQWSSTRRAAQERQRIAEIRAHDCTKAGCGPVCTAFDW